MGKIKPYVKTDWVPGLTPVTSENMTNIEEQVESITNVLVEASSTDKSAGAIVVRNSEGKVEGDIAGNSGTTTKFDKKKLLKVTGVVNGQVQFDGSEEGDKIEIATTLDKGYQQLLDQKLECFLNTKHMQGCPTLSVGQHCYVINDIVVDGSRLYEVIDYAGEVKLDNGLWARLIPRKTITGDLNDLMFALTEKILEGLKSLQDYVITAENGGNAEFLRGFIPSDFRRTVEKLKSGDFSTASDADKVKLINLSDEVIRAMSGNSPVRPEIGESEVVNEKIADGAVNFSKLNIFETLPTYNLFNLEKTILGHVVNGSISTGGAFDNYKTSDFIEVEKNCNYYSLHIRNISFYDDNKNFVRATNNIPNSSLATEFATEECKYVRFSIQIENLEIAMFCKGNYPKDYVPFRKNKLPSLIITEENFEDSIIEPKHTKFIKSTKNLVDITKSTDGVISGSSIVANPYYKTSDFIRINPEKKYIASYARKVAFFNKDKIYLKEFVPQTPYTDIIIQPIANTVYIRISHKKDEENFMICEGEVLGTYEPYGYIIDNLFHKVSDSEDAYTLDGSLFIRNLKIKEEDVIYPESTKNMRVDLLDGTLTISDFSGLKLVNTITGRDNGIFQFNSAYLNNDLVHSMGDDVAPIRTWTTVGANHGYTSVSIITTDHDKTNADLGSVWTSNSKEYVLLRIDGSKLTFGHNYIITDGVVSGDSQRVVGSLSRVSGAVNTSDVSGNFTGGQLYPSINNRTVKILADGKEVVQGSTLCNILTIVETYKIMCYKAIIDWAKFNIGQEFKFSNDIESCVDVSITYEYVSAKKCVVYTEYSFNKKTILAECGTIQQGALSKTGATLYRYLPHTLPKEGYDFSNLVDMTNYDKSLYFYKNDLENIDVPPFRSVDWLIENELKVIGFTAGYIPDKSYSKNIFRKNLDCKIWDLRSSKKNYPVAIGGKTMEVGDCINFIAYRNYMFPTELTNNTILNIGGNIYIFLDSHDIYAGEIDINECEGKDVEVLNSKNFILKTDCITHKKIKFKFTNKGYGVLKIKDH